MTKLKILDPACGSGSFLLGAYQYLLNWHRDEYVKDDPVKWAKGKNPCLYHKSGDDWRLTTDERKRILLNNIYGVDIDHQAVEVTKLSLLLKVLEGEDEETIQRQLSLFQQRALPDLGSNIKCGNSLIGPDFYDRQQINLFDDEEMYRINAFNWEDEFTDIMKNGGFDAVISNPPYIRIQAMKEWAPIEVEFYKIRYDSASKGNYDIYVVFVEKSLSLLNEKGRLGFILPHKFFEAKYGEAIRKIIASSNHLSKIIHFGDQQVFSGATTYTCLLFLDKSGNQQFNFVKAHQLDVWRAGDKVEEGEIQSKNANEKEWNFSVGKSSDIFKKLDKMQVKLGDVTRRIAQGIRTSANNIYVLDLISDEGHLVQARSKELDRTVLLERNILAAFLDGREIKSYRNLYSGKIVIIPYRIDAGQPFIIPEKTLKKEYPHTYEYLRENKTYLENRERGRMKGSNWYGYVYPKNIEVMATPKLLVPDISDRSCFSFDSQGEYAFTSGYGILLKESVIESPKYILGLLNSKVADFYLKQVSTTIRGGFFRYFKQFIEKTPLCLMDFSKASDKTNHDRMVELVDQAIKVYKQMAHAKTPQEKTVLQRQIEATDLQIDKLVYNLYDLTDEEIEIVKGLG